MPAEGRRSRLPKFELHLITEPRRSFPDLLAAIEAAMAGGVTWVQLRDKSASAATMFRQGSDLLEATRRYGVKLAVNDRLDVALAVGADGVHLAGQSLPVSSASFVSERRLLVGRSVHALDEAIQAAADGADYLTFGHIFPTGSKPGLEPRGVRELARIVDAVTIPVMAIGGIHAGNLEQVTATGCAGIAVISAILSASDPQKAARELRAALDASPHRPRNPFPQSQEVSQCA
ncbi:MAG: thiamine phosphate synthase [Chloroflexi bacterium]|nr:thiamine phosphate synthase [Chloroflexota bacterium]